jgi:hypothetical protein
MRLRDLSEDHLPVVLFLIGMAAIACLTPPQSDTFFHLRTGQTIWQMGAIPTSEGFSHTFPGRPWLNHEWVTQLLFFAVHAAGGPFLLTVVSGACAFLAVLASWKLTRGGAEIRLALLVVLLVLTAPEWAVRPQALSLALLMVAMWLAVLNKVAWLPLLTVAWANAHGVVLLGIIVAGAYAFEALVWSRRDLPRAMLVAALCVLAPIGTPLGWRYWPRVAQTVEEARLLGIHEYRSAFADLSSLPFWVMLAVFVAAVAVRAFRVNDWDRSDRLLVLTSSVLAVASIISIRNAPSFALIAAPAISRLIHVQAATGGRPLKRPAYVMIAIAATLALAVVGLQWRKGGTARLRWEPISQLALSAIRACHGPIYNEYADGGTLMWFVPEQKVFVDGRVEVYPSEFLLRVRGADLSGRYHSLFREFGVRCAVTRTGSALAGALRNEAAASLQFSDDRWTVFVVSPSLQRAAR